jgi:hypothetical protein
MVGLARPTVGLRWVLVSALSLLFGLSDFRNLARSLVVLGRISLPLPFHLHSSVCVDLCFLYTSWASRFSTRKTLTHMSGHFRDFGKELGVTDPKGLEDVYKITQDTS